MKAQEHRALGDAAGAGAVVNLGGDGPDERFLLGFGDVVALSGDFFVADGLPGAASASNGSRAGVDDVEVAFRLGARDPSLSGARLHQAVGDATGASGDASSPRRGFPSPLPATRC